MVGYNYTRGGAVNKVPAPLIRLAVAIYVRQLAPGVPRAMLSTSDPNLKPTAANFELAVNSVPDRIGLQQTFRKVVTESLFSIGVLKIGLHSVGKMLNHEVGKTFVDLVTLDDLIIDMSANRMSSIQYIGNSYWMDLDEVRSSDRYSYSGKQSELEPDDYQLFTQTDDGSERAEVVSSDESPTVYRDKIQLRDLWLPDEGKVVTYAVSKKQLLNVVDWTGPTNGPYPILAYEYVPGNLLPLPPVASWLDMHELANELFRKLGRQAESEKTVQGFQGGNDADVIAYKTAVDGDGITYHGQPPVSLKSGGANPNTMAVFKETMSLFSYFAGNLDSMGGLAAQTETLGQDRLLSSAASAQIKDMADVFVEFSNDVFNQIAFYEWNDPGLNLTLDKPVPGADLSVPVVFNSRAKKGRFSDYNIRIDTYSVQDRSPSTQLSKLLTMFERVVLPLMPAIQEQGGVLQTQSILADAARLSDSPELSEWVQYTQADASTTGYDQSGAPQNTTRRYERATVPAEEEAAVPEPEPTNDAETQPAA
jgi:hypothetical protein